MRLEALATTLGTRAGIGDTTGDAADAIPFRRDIAGALGDLGTFAPLAVVLITTCGLSTTVVLTGAGAFYAMVAAVYRLPVPVQPMKAVSAIAVAEAVSPGVIAASALILGLVLTTIGSTGVLDRIARLVPLWVVRAVQVSVGLALCKVAIELVGSPPHLFEHQLPTPAASALCIIVLLGCLWRTGLILPILAISTVVAVVLADGPIDLGPSSVVRPAVSWSDLGNAVFLLVLPQLPLTITSSCIATADASHRYYGKRAAGARPSRLAMTIGIGNFAGSLFGTMPTCHGSGGVSAHHIFGARTWRAPAVMATLLVVLGLTLGAGSVTVLAAFPLPVLAGLLGIVAVTHLRLVADLNRTQQKLAVALGATGFIVGITWMLLAVGSVLAPLGLAHRQRSRRRISNRS